MGLQQQLGFTAKPGNAAQRGVQRVAQTKQGSWLLQRTLYRLDRPVYGWTGGRIIFSEVVAGIPVIMLTATGAKTGLPRTMPVLGIPLNGDLVLMGTNFAQPGSPAWALNLEANPRAHVDWHGHQVDVVARAATPEEREAAWTAAIRFYSGFAKYRERITERPVRIFILEPAG